MKTSLVEKSQRKLSLNSEDYVYDDTLLSDYFDDAILIIKDWKRNYNDNYILQGNYDSIIVDFIIQSINYNGLEGQSSNSANGISRTFVATPKAMLQSSIPQSL